MGSYWDRGAILDGGGFDFWEEQRERGDGWWWWGRKKREEGRKGDCCSDVKAGMHP